MCRSIPTALLLVLHLGSCILDKPCNLFPILHNAIVGETYDFYCAVYQFNSSSYAFNIIVGSKDIEMGLDNYTEYINSTHLMLSIKPHLISRPGRIIAECYNKANSFMCRDLIKYGYRPSPVILDRELTVLNNWNDLHLTYQLEYTNEIFPATYQVLLKNSTDGVPFWLCHSLESYSICTDEHILDNVNDDGLLLVKFIGENSVGSFKSNLQFLNLFDIVVPGLVKSVSFSVGHPYQSKMCFVPPNIQYIARTKYLINYFLLVDGNGQEIILNSSDLEHTGTDLYCWLVKDLKPASLYNVTIQALSLPKSKPGPTLVTQFTTAETVPMGPLITTDGGFEEVSRTVATRNVRVYWQNMAPGLQGGKLTVIEVQYLCGHIKQTFNVSYTGLRWADLISLPTDLDCIVFLDAATKQGFNATLKGNQTGLRIPQKPHGKAARYSSLENVTAVVEEDGAHTVSWNLSSGTDQPAVTVFYCKGLQHCKGRVQWVKATPLQMSVTIASGSIIELGGSEVGLRIGVSVVHENSGSDGIFWIACMYSRQELPGVPVLRTEPHRHSMKVEIESQTCQTSLNPIGFPYATNLYYCIRFNNSICKGKVYKMTVSSAVTVIDGLAARQYLLWGESVSQHSVSARSPIHTVAITRIVLSLNKSLGIAFGLGVPLLALVVYGIITCFRWGSQCPARLKDMLTISINVPRSVSVENRMNINHEQDVHLTQLTRPIMVDNQTEPTGGGSGMNQSKSETEPSIQTSLDIEDSVHWVERPISPHLSFPEPRQRESVLPRAPVDDGYAKAADIKEYCPEITFLQDLPPHSIIFSDSLGADEFADYARVTDCQEGVLQALHSDSPPLSDEATGNEIGQDKEEVQSNVREISQIPPLFSIPKLDMDFQLADSSSPDIHSHHLTFDQLQPDVQYAPGRLIEEELDSAILMLVPPGDVIDSNSENSEMKSLVAGDEQETILPMASDYAQGGKLTYC